MSSIRGCTKDGTGGVYVICGMTGIWGITGNGAIGLGMTGICGKPVKFIGKLGKLGT
jgi:hypothetical protein